MYGQLVLKTGGITEGHSESCARKRFGTLYRSDRCALRRTWCVLDVSKPRKRAALELFVLY
jgi:hypothetical protein